MRKKMTRTVIDRFLSALVNTRCVEDASKAVKVSKRTLYRHRDADPAFRAAWEAALDRSDWVLTEEALRRIVEGFEHPVFYKGEEVAKVRKFNDSLLIALLKLERRRRERRDAIEAERETQKDDLTEILELIDGKTRTLRDGAGRAG